MSTTPVPVYDSTGSQIDEFIVPDTLEYSGGRVSRGQKHYYKGAGVEYSRHLVNSYDPDTYTLLEETGIIYGPYSVCKSAFEGKWGVFQERYQPFFPDFIGSCSIKEGPLVINSMTFERSSVDVIDVVEFDRQNQQSYYVLDYLCGRRGYVGYTGSPEALTDLLEYMISSDWNFLWDKNSISDVSFDGRVTDLADLFQSADIAHKLGTVYSIHYSLALASPEMYVAFLYHNGLDHYDARSFIDNSVSMLERWGVDTSPLYPSECKDDENDLYKHRVLEYLIRGKNCANCACDLFIDSGIEVMNQYIEDVTGQFENV
jgi:hypothetical protein